MINLVVAFHRIPPMEKHNRSKLTNKVAKRNKKSLKIFLKNGLPNATSNGLFGVLVKLATQHKAKLLATPDHERRHPHFHFLDPLQIIQHRFGKMASNSGMKMQAKSMRPLRVDQPRFHFQNALYHFQLA